MNQDWCGTHGRWGAAPVWASEQPPMPLPLFPFPIPPLLFDITFDSPH